MKIDFQQQALTPGGRAPEDLGIVLPPNPFSAFRAILADAARREGDPPLAAALCARAVRDHWKTICGRRATLQPQLCDIADLQRQCLLGVHRTVRDGIIGRPGALAYADLALQDDTALLLQCGDVTLRIMTPEGRLMSLSQQHRDAAGQLLVHVGHAPEDPLPFVTAFGITQEVTLILSTDGLYSALSEDEIAYFLAQVSQTGAAQAALQIRQRLIQNHFDDDVTYCILRVSPDMPAPDFQPSRKRLSPRHWFGRHRRKLAQW